MPLKIVHHKEQTQELKKEKVSLNIQENLIRMFSFCKNIVDIATLILEKANFLQLVEDNTLCDVSVPDNIMELRKKQIDTRQKQIEGMLEIFNLIVGKKVSLLEAVSKSTLIMQKINIIANDFGISLVQNECANDDVLTDEDIDIMVQMVKDFGEQQIREDAKECREKLLKKQQSNINKSNEIDVYDVYHDCFDKS